MQSLSALLTVKSAYLLQQQHKQQSLEVSLWRINGKESGLLKFSIGSGYFCGKLQLVPSHSGGRHGKVFGTAGYI